MEILDLSNKRSITVKKSLQLTDSTRDLTHREKQWLCWYDHDYPSPYWTTCSSDADEKTPNQTSTPISTGNKRPRTHRNHCEIQVEKECTVETSKVIGSARRSDDGEEDDNDRLDFVSDLTLDRLKTRQVEILSKGDMYTNVQPSCHIIIIQVTGVGVEKIIRLTSAGDP